MKTLFSTAVCLGFAFGLGAGTVLTENLPPGAAIVNIDARRDGAAGYNGDQSLWYRPFYYAGSPAQITLAPGTYSFRVINPADAAAQFPALTSGQTNQMFTAWTYNSPWITAYLVFDAGAVTNETLPQLFDGSPGTGGFNTPAEAYDDAVTKGYADLLRTGALGRNSATRTKTFTLTNTTTLLFVVADYYLPDNSGGVSILIRPASELSVPWWTVDGGGGTSSDGPLTISGTVGQPDAGASSDGTLSVQGGFWAMAIEAMSPAKPASGYQIYYSTFDYPNDAVWSINGDGSGNTLIVAGQWPRLSPDGGKLLYHPRGHPENVARNEMAVFNLTSGTSTTLFSHSDYLVSYDWSRDGTRVVFDLGCALYSIPSSTAGAPTMLLGSDCYDDAPSLSPTDGSIAFHNSFLGLMLAGSDGSGCHHVDNTSPGDYWPSWSPDGTWLVFPGTNGVFKIRPDGSGRTNLWSQIPGAAQAIVDGAYTYGPARFTPDGQWVIAAFNLGGTNGLYAIAADGSGTLKTIRSVAPPAQIFNFIGGVVDASAITSPLLSIAVRGPGQATISWTPNTPGFVLQEATSLAPTNWANSLSGPTNPVDIATPLPAKFFRLVRP